MHHRTPMTHRTSLPHRTVRIDVPTVLVANPTAQSGKAANVIQRARALLDAANIRHTFLATEPRGGTVEYVRRAIDHDGCRCVIYMGGDGTFAEVAKGILASNHAATTVMAMLPLGTANDQGKSFGLGAGKRALEQNVAVIAAGETASFDVGSLEVERAGKIVFRDLFFDSFSVGMAASSLATRNRDRDRVRTVPGLAKIYRDYATYGGALLQRFLETYFVQTKFDVDAIIDGRLLHLPQVLDVIVKNTEIFGGEWVFDAEAASDDGRFELISIRGRRDLSLRMIAGFRHNPLGEDALSRVGLSVSETHNGANFELIIKVASGAWPGAQIDGEEVPAGERYRIAVQPKALHLIVPHDFVEPAKV